MEKRKLIIIGSGPAGYTAALYAARAQLEPLMLEGFFSGPAGGQLMTTTEVENYPGFPDGITGPALMDAMRRQAERFGTHFVTEDALSVTGSKLAFKVATKTQTYEAECIIVATGATAKRLEIPGAGDGEFWQKGVTACAICDGAMPIFRNKELYVIGGGDSAMEEALFLTRYGSKVAIVHRRGEFRASKIMADRALQHPKVGVLWNSEVARIEGDTVVRAVVVRNVKTGKEERHPAAGVFFAIGHVPNTAFLGGLLETTPAGYVVVQPPYTRTSCEGIFAAGDVQDPHYRQAVTAAGSGCAAALDAERWLAAQGVH